MKQRILYCAQAMGLFALCAWITRKRLRILCYHGIWDGPGQYGNYLFMSPGKFRSRLQLLRRWGARVFPLDEALERLRHGQLPARSVVITIDDGWKSTANHMGPALQEAGYPATLYVTTYYVLAQRRVFNVALSYALSCYEGEGLTLQLAPGINVYLDPAKRAAVGDSILKYALELANDEARQTLLRKVVEQLGLQDDPAWMGSSFFLASWGDLQQLQCEGVDLQLHTHRHQTRTRQGESCLQQEIEDNRQRLQAIANSTLEHFCYPSGEYEPGDWAELGAAGIKSATTTDIGLCRAGSNFYALPRILDGQAVSELELEAELSGFLECLRGARRLLSGKRV
ncbi:MAG: polysaccharide deacetylase family protein [Parahaliea sp.]